MEPVEIGRAITSEALARITTAASGALFIGVDQLGNIPPGTLRDTLQALKNQIDSQLTTTRRIDTSGPIIGGGDLTADRTIGLQPEGITNAFISQTAAIAESKLSLATDASPEVSSRRSLGPGSNQAAPGDDPRLNNTRTPTPGSVVNASVDPAAAIEESKIALASDAAANVPSRRSLGPGATQAAAGNDPRLNDTRTPTSGSVTDASVSGTAAISESKLNLASDGPANQATRRTLGPGPAQAAAGNDSRLTDKRTPADGSVTPITMATDHSATIHCTSITRPTTAKPGQQIFETDTKATLRNLGTEATPNWVAPAGGSIQTARNGNDVANEISKINFAQGFSLAQEPFGQLQLGFEAPTEQLQGAARVATKEEAVAATDNQTIITPKRLRDVQATHLRFADLFTDFASTGNLPVQPATPSLTTNITQQSVWIQGALVQSPVTLSKTFAANKITYVDINADGTYHYIEEPNDGVTRPVPIIDPPRLRLFRIWTDATGITWVEDLRKKRTTADKVDIRNANYADTGSTRFATYSETENNTDVNAAVTPKGLEQHRQRTSDYFYAHRLTTNQALAITAGSYKILFNAEVTDPEAVFDTSLSRFSPSRLGYYHFNAQAYLSGLVDGTLQSVMLYKNGTLNMYGQYATVNGNVRMHNQSWIIHQTVPSDYWEVWVYTGQTTGTPVIVQGASVTYWKGYYIGRTISG